MVRIGLRVVEIRRTSSGLSLDHVGRVVNALGALRTALRHLHDRHRIPFRSIPQLSENLDAASTDRRSDLLPRPGNGMHRRLRGDRAPERHGFIGHRPGPASHNADAEQLRPGIAWRDAIAVVIRSRLWRLRG
jgi:hypothetical protein